MVYPTNNISLGQPSWINSDYSYLYEGNPINTPLYPSLPTPIVQSNSYAPLSYPPLPPPVNPAYQYMQTQDQRVVEVYQGVLQICNNIENLPDLTHLSLARLQEQEVNASQKLVLRALKMAANLTRGISRVSLGLAAVGTIASIAALILAASPVVGVTVAVAVPILAGLALCGLITHLATKVLQQIRYAHLKATYQQEAREEINALKAWKEVSTQILTEGEHNMRQALQQIRGIPANPVEKNYLMLYLQGMINKIDMFNRLTWRIETERQTPLLQQILKQRNINAH